LTPLALFQVRSCLSLFFFGSMVLLELLLLIVTLSLRYCGILFFEI